MEKLKTFFLGNHGSTRTIFKNTIWLTLAEGLSGILKFFLLVLAARQLGATEYGTFTFALGFVALFGLFLDAGLNQIVVREFAKDSQNERFFPALIALQIALGIVTLILVGSLSFAASPDPSVRWMIFVLGMYLALGGFLNLLFSAFRARQRMDYEVYPRMLQAFLTAGLGILSLVFYRDAFILCAVYLFAALAGVIAAVLLFRAKMFPLRIAVDFETWKKFLKMSYSLALLGGLATMVYSNLDSTMMGFFGNLTENGWYNAAYKVVSMTLLPMTVVAQSFYPALSVATRGPKTEIQSLWNREMGIMIVLGLPILFGGIQVAPQLIHFLYKEEYEPSVRALQMLLFVGFFAYLHHVYHHILIIFDRQKTVLVVLAVGVGVNLGLNAILIPLYSLYGAAWGAIATHFLILVTLGVATARFTAVKPVNAEVLTTFAISLVSSLVMYSILELRAFSLFPALGIGAASYFVVFFGLKRLKSKYLWN